MISVFLQVFTAICILLSACSTIVLAAITGFTLVYMAKQLKVLRQQITHASEATLISLSNQQNWKLFEHRNKLPPALPSWFDLTSDTEWAWRVLFFNRLNLLNLFYNEKELKNKAECDAWVSKANYMFKSFGSNDPRYNDEKICEGRAILKQILKPEEGYPVDFRNWLKDEEIIPPELFET